MGAIHTAGKLKLRASAVFDPGAEPGVTLEAWWDFARATTSSGRIVTVPNRGPLTRTLVRPSGSVGPSFPGTNDVDLYTPSGTFLYDNVNDQRLVCTTLSIGTDPYTVVIVGTQDLPLAGQTPAQTGRSQYLIDQAGRNILLTFAGTQGDDLLCNNGNQVQLGAVLKGQKFIIAYTGGGGASNYFCKNSPVPDIVANTGTLSLTGDFYIGGIRSGGLANGWSGKIAQALLFRGILSITTVLPRMFRWLQGIHHQPITFDEPGTIYRFKTYFNTNGGQTSADGFIFPFVTPVESMLAASGALRAKMRYEQSAENQVLGVASPEVTQGTTWNSVRAADGTHTIVAGGVTYKTDMGYGSGGSTTSLAEVESFVVMGGGQPAQFAWRDDPTLPFVEVPFASGTTIPAFTPTGKMDLGGNRVTNNTSPVVGYVRELVTYRDGAKPSDFTPPTYTLGRIVFWGDDLAAVQQGGHWAIRTIQKLVAGGKNSYPRPIQLGVSGRTFAMLAAARATEVDPLYVSSGLNILFLTGGRNDIAGGLTAQQAYDAGAAIIATLRTAGWLVAWCTQPPSTTGVTETVRADYNSKIIAAPTAQDKIVDFGAMSPAQYVRTASAVYVPPTVPTAVSMASTAYAQLVGWIP